MASAFPLILFPFCLIAAALSDIRRYIIPNELSIVLCAGFLLAAILAGMSMQDIAWSIAAGAVMLAFGFVLFCFNTFGAGDAKLMAAVALWFGWPSFLIALLYVTLVGGALALAVYLALFLARAFPGMCLKSKMLSRFAATSKPNLPYGIAIAIGSLLAFDSSPLYKAMIASVTGG